MKEIIINDHNMSDSDVSERVVRAKGLLLTSNGKILLAHNNNTYQFPGGHVDEGESMSNCITREIKEETGIDVKVAEEPFLCIKTYDNDYFGTGRKVLSCIYYYWFITDDKPNFSETHYDELELATDFNLFYLNFADLSTFLNDCIEDGTIDAQIGREMLYATQVSKDLYGTF